MENILKIGIATIEELEDIVKAFRLMNTYAKRKRFIVSREDIKDIYGNIIVKKAHDIDLPIVKQLLRNYKPDTKIKIFSSDEGIALITSFNSNASKQFSEQLSNNIKNIGGSIYEPFIDILTSFHELFNLFQKGYSPKLIITGYIPIKNLKQELTIYDEVKAYDPYIRVIDIIHDELKPKSYLKGASVFHFVNEPKIWQKLILKIVNEYTKPYFMEEISNEHFI